MGVDSGQLLLSEGRGSGEGKGARVSEAEEAKEAEDQIPTFPSGLSSPSVGGREAAAYFTGQDRVKNKTAANSTPRVLQGLSMTPSFPLSPKPGSTSPEGLPPQVQWLLAFMQTTV